MHQRAKIKHVTAQQVSPFSAVIAAPERQALVLASLNAAIVRGCRSSWHVPGDVPRDDKGVGHPLHGLIATSHLRRCVTQARSGTHDWITHASLVSPLCS